MRICAQCYKSKLVWDFILLVLSVRAVSTFFYDSIIPIFAKPPTPAENIAFGKSWWNTKMPVWLCSASEPFSSVFQLEDSVAKGDFRKHVKYPPSWVGPQKASFTYPDFGIWRGTEVWAGHRKEPWALGEPTRHPVTAVPPILGPMCCRCPQGGTEEGRGCRALPLPRHADPGGRVGWAPTDGANYIPRLLTHDVRSWAAILNLRLRYHFPMGFAHFLSPGSAVWVVRCESDGGINLALEKKHQGRPPFLNKGTFDLGGFPIQTSARAPKQPCQHKQGTARHNTGMGARGKVGSGKKVPVAPKAGQTGTTAPHIYPVRLKWNKMSPSLPIHLWLTQNIQRFIM